MEKLMAVAAGKARKRPEQRAAMATLKQLGLSAKPPSVKKPNP